MKPILQIALLIDQMEKVSKRILAAGYVIFLAANVVAVVVLLFYTYRCADITTGLYWYHELVVLASDCIIICVMPVLIFEVLLIWSGNKKNEKK